MKPDAIASIRDEFGIALMSIDVVMSTEFKTLHARREDFSIVTCGELSKSRELERNSLLSLLLALGDELGRFLCGRDCGLWNEL